MKKTNILILVGLAIAGVYIYNRTKPSSPASTSVKPNDTPTTTNTNTSACPVGQVACSDGKNCYDPSINYLVDPCSNAY